MLNKKHDIGLRIKEFATKNNLSLAQLSRQLGMKNPQGLNPYINGGSFPGGELLIKLSELGCNINWLLNGDTAMNSIHEPKLEYMTYTQLEEKIMILTLELKELKAENYDLQRERKSLEAQIEELNTVILELRKALAKSQGGNLQLAQGA